MYEIICLFLKVFFSMLHYAIVWRTKSGGHYRNFFLRFDPQKEPALCLWKASPKHVKNRGPLSPIFAFDFQVCSVECLPPNGVHVSPQRCDIEVMVTKNNTNTGSKSMKKVTQNGAKSVKNHDFGGSGDHPRPILAQKEPKGSKKSEK